ncbi:MAG: ComEC/Rec2 family competence protein, partial [Candidatus Korobacteraceae bacterium]
DLRLLAERFAPFLGRTPAQWLLARGAGVVIAAYEVAVVSAIVQLSLALPMAMYFHRATLQALPANVIAVPLTVLLMPSALAALALSSISAWMAKPFALLAGAALDGMADSATLLGTDLRVATPEAAICTVAAGTLALAIWSARRRVVLAATGVAAVAASALWITAVPPHPQFQPGMLEVTAIDVGQADSILVVSPDGRTLLVDAAGSIGPGVSEFDFGEDVISPYLWERGITRLDAVAVTHAHSDHIGGMGSIIKNFQPRELWVGPNVLTRQFTALLRQASVQNVAVIYRRGGDSFRFGEAEVQVLSPPADWKLAKRVRNDDSLVFRIAYKESSAVLAADAERRSERAIAALPAESVRADLLKVSHNGSATSTTPEFLAAIQPKLAVISVGFRNQFRHPRPEVLERLSEQRVATYRTDTAGAVTFYLDGKSAQAVRLGNVSLR